MGAALGHDSDADKMSPVERVGTSPRTLVVNVNCGWTFDSRTALKKISEMRERTRRAGFTDEDLLILTDLNGSDDERSPTKENILQSCRWLLKGESPIGNRPYYWVHYEETASCQEVVDARRSHIKMIINELTKIGHSMENQDVRLVISADHVTILETPNLPYIYRGHTLEINEELLSEEATSNVKITYLSLRRTASLHSSKKIFPVLERVGNGNPITFAWIIHTLVNGRDEPPCDICNIGFNHYTSLGESFVIF